MPGRPGTKVPDLFVNSNDLAHSCTNRTYAVTGRNKWAAGVLYTIPAAQFGVGVYMFIFGALNPSKYFRPLHALELCD